MEKYFFDDDKIQYMELPMSPLAIEEQKEEMPWESKDIYLKQKDGSIIGLHAIGFGERQINVHHSDDTVTQETIFNAEQQWGNEYDEDHNMLGRGSFRVHEPIEFLAKELVADGWEIYEGPKRKEKT